MLTVDAKTSDANISQNTGREGRERPPRIECAECGGHDDCTIDLARVMGSGTAVAR